MRIESAYKPDVTTGQHRAEPVSIDINEGDTLNVRVLANENGNVRLRTPEGVVLTARFIGDAALSPGDDVQLFVAEIHDGVIYMTPTEAAEYTYGSDVTHMLRDGDYAQYARMLDSLNLPVTRETLTLMREILATNPKLTLEQAAFLAANNIPANAETLSALPQFLYGGDRAQGLQNLLESLMSQAQTFPAGVAQETTETPLLTAFLQALLPRETPVRSGGNGAIAQEAAENTEVAGQVASDGETQETASSARQVDVREIRGAAADSAFTAARETGLRESQVVGGNAELEPDAQSAANKTQPDINANQTVVDGKNTEEQATSAVINTAKQNDVNAPATAREALARTLSQMPELRALPPRRIAELADTLLRVAGDAETLVPKDGSPVDPKRVAAFIEKMFPEISEHAERVGQALKSARDELPARLALLEEAVARMSAPNKEGILEQTRRLRQDERLWNDMERYVYAQVPVTINGERTNAELYIYKRKRERTKIDPTDVNILLAIDLPNLGHTESLVGVRGRDVSLQMRVSDERTKDFFTEYAPKLHTMLDSIGYRLDNAHFSCEDMDASPLTALLTLDETRRSVHLDVAV